MEGHVSESTHHVHAGTRPFCRVWRWHTLWLWARRRHETGRCTHPFFTSCMYIVSLIFPPPDIVSCRSSMYLSPGRQVNVRPMAQQVYVTFHPTITETAQWRRLEGVAHLRKLWWRPTPVPHGSSKQPRISPRSIGQKYLQLLPIFSTVTTSASGNGRNRPRLMLARIS